MMKFNVIKVTESSLYKKINGKDGSVNRYKDNGDGGHSHEYWKF